MKIDLSKQQLDQIRAMAGFGLPIERIALVLGVSERTLYRKKSMIPEVREAFEQGLAQADFAISKTLYDMAVTDRNLPALIWWEKTRLGRSDRATISHESDQDLAPKTVSKVFIHLPDNERDDEGIVKVGGKLPDVSLVK